MWIDDVRGVLEQARSGSWARRIIFEGDARTGGPGALFDCDDGVLSMPDPAFTVLENIRVRLTAKLSRVPMGFILDTPSGKFKTMLVDTIKKLEQIGRAHV